MIEFLTPAEVAAFSDHPDYPGSGSALQGFGLAADSANEFRQHCRNKGHNWPDIVNQAFALGANDPESFARAVEHLFNQTQETTLL